MDHSPMHAVSVVMNFLIILHLTGVSGSSTSQAFTSSANAIRPKNSSGQTTSVNTSSTHMQDSLGNGHRCLNLFVSERKPPQTPRAFRQLAVKVDKVVVQAVSRHPQILLWVGLPSTKLVMKPEVFPHTVPNIVTFGDRGDSYGT